MRLPVTLDEYRDGLRRFLRAAENKRAQLVIFPELAGVMLVPPLLGDFRSSLLLRADVGRRRSASPLQKLVGAVAGSAAGVLKANYQTGMGGLLDVAAGTLWDRYVETFGGLAKEFGVTVVAPSAYLPDPFDGVIRNLAVVFGPDGAQLGAQAKVILSAADERFCQPGSNWEVIHTEAGALGIMIGSDVLFPEVGRLLAFQGAEVLITLAAATSQADYNKLRAGALARMQDNQLLAACAFLVGKDAFDATHATTYLGKSAVCAPQELTPRFNGVLVEMGNFSSEGVLTAEWDFTALRTLWEKNDARLRHQFNASQATQILATIYRQLQNTPRLEDQGGAADNATPMEAQASTKKPLIALDDLPIIASITSRWPPYPVTGGGDLPVEEAVAWSVVGAPQNASPGADPRYEEETDEMDALDDAGRPRSESTG
jgi:predicted amidohydrolase